MFRKAMMLLLVFVVLNAGAALAQYQRQATARRPPPPPQYQHDHKVEITGLYGYMWTTSRSASYQLYSGRLDIKSSEYWGVALDINVHPFAQLELLYTRQDSELMWERGGIKTSVADAKVEYFQIGAIKGIRNDKVMPFTSFTLGATRFSSDEPNTSDEWKFSIILGLGAKVYLGERIGLRFQGRLPFTFTGGGGGFYYGSNGSYVVVGGSGVLQTSLSAGLFLMI